MRRLAAGALVIGLLAGLSVWGAPSASAAPPAWCSTVTTGNPTNTATKVGWIGYTGSTPATVDWPDIAPSDAVADECFNQVLGSGGQWPRAGSVYPAKNFRVSNGASCQSVITEGSFFTEGLNVWEQLEAWLLDHFPLLGGMVDSMMGSYVETPGYALMGTTCWVPKYFQDEAQGPLSVAALFPQSTLTAGTGCRVSSSFPFFVQLYGTLPGSNGWGSCTVVAEDLGDVLRVHWVGTMFSFEQLEAVGTANRAELVYSDWGMIDPSDGKRCSVAPGGCGYVTLVDSDVEVGVLTGDDFALPNPGVVPGWVDQSLLGACRLVKFVGDDLTGVTWAGGEVVNFEGVYQDGVTRTDSMTAGVVVTLGEVNGEPVTVPVIATLPGEFSVTVPELDEALVPNVQFEITAGPCHAMSWYDPTGEGGAPGSVTERMGFTECVDTGAGGALPDSSGITDVALEAATWIVCGVYVLFVPERGFSYHLAAGQVEARSGSFGDLVSAWQVGGRVAQSVAGNTSAAAGFSVAGVPVSIPAPSGSAVTVLRLVLSVSVLVGAALKGIRLVARALGAPAPEVDADDSRGSWRVNDDGAEWRSLDRD